MIDREDWDEKELEDEDSFGELPSEGGRAWLPWALWALLPLGLGLVYFSLRGGEPEPEPRELPAASEPEPTLPAAPEEPEAEAIDLPPLGESDGFVRDLVGRLSSDPFLGSILDVEDLVRKFVVAVANIADGASPRRQLDHIGPEAKFQALQTRERTVMDPESARRYDVPARFFGSLDAEAVAKLYTTLEPLFEEAHRELGRSDRKGFRDTLSLAIFVLTSAPVVEGPIPLRAVSVNYAFEDPALEALAPAQKHLVRMGPENTRLIQKKLDEIARALGIRSRPPS